MPGDGAERHRVLGIDAALDGVAVEFHVALRQREIVAGGDADLFDDEVDVGDHLGHRMLHLDAGVHFDEVEFAVLVEEFDGADAEIFDVAHRFGDGLADLVAAVGIERGRGAFLPDFLMPALQRAVALAEMDGAAFAVAEHLDLDVARPFEISFQIKRVVAERRLGLGPRHGERHAISLSARTTFMPRPPPPAAALSMTGKPMSRASRSASSSEPMPPSEPGTVGMPSSFAARLAAILSPISRICSGRGPMKCTLCSPRISANRAFSARKP